MFKYGLVSIGCCIVFILTCNHVYSQSNQLRISGKVIDEQEEPVSYASVFVITDDSVFVASCLSDSLGVFSLSYPADKKGIFCVSHLAYKNYSKKIDELNENPVTIILSQDVRSLGMVSITAKREPISMRGGNLVANVPAIPGYENMSTAKILNRLPGVSKESDGKFSLNGTAATIYIDGIKQSFNAQALKSYLESLPASSLSEIELLTIPPANYDASIPAVINIKLNKHVPEGQILDAGLFSGMQEKRLYDTGFDVFYMVKKNRILFNTTFRYNNNSLYQTGTDSTAWKQKFVNHVVNHDKYSGRENALTSNSNLTLDLNHGHKLDFNAFLYYGKPNTKYNNTITQYDIPSQLKSAQDYKQNITGRDDMYSGTIKYTSPYDKTTSVAIYYSGLWGGIRSNSNYDQWLQPENWDKYMTSKVSMEGHMYTLASDITSRLSKSVKLNYGIKGDANFIEDVSEYKSTDGRVLEESYFWGREAIIAAYAKVNYVINNTFIMNASLRGEYTNYKLNYKSSGYKKSEDYVDLFPVFTFSFRSNPYTVVLAYNSLINRQNYMDLLPGERYINKYYSKKGNPDLLPMKYYVCTVKNIFYGGAASLQFQYQRINDYYGHVLVENNSKIYITPLNYADLDRFFLTVDAPVELLGDKLYGNLRFQASWTDYRRLHESFIAPVNRKRNYFNYNMKANIQYEITDRLSVDCLFSYMGRYKSLTYDSDKLWYMDAGITYSFMKSKQLIVSFDAKNIFNKYDIYSDNYFGDNFRKKLVNSDGTVFNISIKYKFNKGKNIRDQYRDSRPDTQRMNK